MNKQEKNDLKIICPFCNAEYTAKMEADLAYSMGSEMTGPYNGEIHIKIYCENCKKLVYTKSESAGF